MLPLSLGIVWRGAMLALGLAAAVPTRLGQLMPHPAPVREYADALARVAQTRASEDSIVAPGGSSLLLVHGRRVGRAVVLLHGYTDSPRQFAELADSLCRTGDNVYVPRLPHHAERGADVRALARITAEELAKFGDATIDVAAGLGDSVVVIGLSAGATIASWIAQYRPEARRVVMIAPAFEAAHVPSILERPLVNLSSRVPNMTHRSPSDTMRPDLDPGVATHGLAQLFRLGIAVRRAANERPPKATEITFIVNANDHTVKAEPVFDLAMRWRSAGASVSVYEFPDSLQLPHNVMEPVRRGGNVTAVYSLLEALAHGERPPAWVADLRTTR